MTVKFCANKIDEILNPFIKGVITLEGFLKPTNNNKLYIAKRVIKKGAHSKLELLRSAYIRAEYESESASIFLKNKRRLRNTRVSSMLNSISFTVIAIVRYVYSKNKAVINATQKNIKNSPLK